MERGRPAQPPARARTAAPWVTAHATRAASASGTATEMASSRHVDDGRPLGHRERRGIAPAVAVGRQHDQNVDHVAGDQRRRRHRAAGHGHRPAARADQRGRADQARGREALEDHRFALEDGVQRHRTHR